jgi:putative phosphoesterase
MDTERVDGRGWKVRRSCKSNCQDMINVGLISDTHRLLRDEAVACLKGSDLIIHAGDIGSMDVISGLEKLAPVRAIRGNIDRGTWADAFPEEDLVEIEDTRIYVLHDRNAMTLGPESSGFGVVVSGHSHNPEIERLGGVLYVNPGSAGPRRFKLPVAIAKLRIKGAEVEASIQELTC